MEKIEKAIKSSTRETVWILVWGVAAIASLLFWIPGLIWSFQGGVILSFAHIAIFVSMLWVCLKLVPKRNAKSIFVLITLVVWATLSIMVVVFWAIPIVSK